MSDSANVIPLSKNAPVPVAQPEAAALAERVKTNVLQMDIEALLRRKGEHGEEIGAKQFARMAAEFLLQEYEMAKAEATLKFGSTVGLLFNNTNNLLAKFLIPAGLLSAFAVDVAIFGGAHTALMVASPWFKGLAIGSLLTATLIGTTENRAARGAYVATAIALSTAAAYLAASGNPEFKGLWAGQFAHLDVDYNAAAAQLATAEADKALLTTRVHDLDIQVRTGGVGGRHVMVDGNPHNDYLVGDHKAAQTQLATATSAAAKYGEEVRRLAPLRPSQTYGLYGGALYLGAWLTLAQMQVANIISKGPQWLKQARAEATHTAAQKELVRALEQNPRRVEAKTSTILERMKEVYIGALTAKHGEEGARKITARLFTEASEEAMVKDSAALFSEGLKRRAATGLRERLSPTAAHL